MVLKSSDLERAMGRLVSAYSGGAPRVPPRATPTSAPAPLASRLVADGAIRGYRRRTVRRLPVEQILPGRRRRQLRTLHRRSCYRVAAATDPEHNDLSHCWHRSSEDMASVLDPRHLPRRLHSSSGSVRRIPQKNIDYSLCFEDSDIPARAVVVEDRVCRWPTASNAAAVPRQRFGGVCAARPGQEEARQSGGSDTAERERGPAPRPSSSSNRTGTASYCWEGDEAVRTRAGHRATQTGLLRAGR